MVNGAKEYGSLSVLFVINLLNYADRNTIAGVLPRVQDYYDINDAYAGLIQTVFLVFFIIASPLCGYLGDRYNRKWVIFGGNVIWIISVVASSFIPGNLFWLFMLLRGMVGIGEASYSNVVPTMITDMFTGKHRSAMFMLFYLAVPFGSGLGYIIGSNAANIGKGEDNWQWGVRITAVPGIILLILFLFLVFEPERGATEKLEGTESACPNQPSTYSQDLIHLITNKTYIFCTIGYTALVFVAGTMTWWTPTAIQYDVAWKDGYINISQLPDHKTDQINMFFGAITCIGGLVGVIVGTVIATYWLRGSVIPSIQSDLALPLVCTIGSLIACPLFLCLLLFSSNDNAVMLWLIMFFTITFMCLNWGLNVDIIMSVIVPWRRSTAFSWYMLIAHLCGDASGPYIVGAVSDRIRKSDSPKDHFHSIVGAFYITVGMLLISAIFYAITALTLKKDLAKAVQIIEEVAAQSNSKNNLPQATKISIPRVELKKLPIFIEEIDSDSRSNLRVTFEEENSEEDE